MSDKKSTIKGAMISSYDDEVSIKVYLTAAATIALFREEDPIICCMISPSSVILDFVTYLKLREVFARSSHSQLADTSCLDIPDPVIANIGSASCWRGALSPSCSGSVTLIEQRVPQLIRKLFQLVGREMENDLFERVQH